MSAAMLPIGDASSATNTPMAGYLRHAAPCGHTTIKQRKDFAREAMRIACQESLTPYTDTDDSGQDPTIATLFAAPPLALPLAPPLAPPCTRGPAEQCYPQCYDPRCYPQCYPQCYDPRCYPQCYDPRCYPPFFHESQSYLCQEASRAWNSPLATENWPIVTWGFPAHPIPPFNPLY